MRSSPFAALRRDREQYIYMYILNNNVQWQRPLDFMTILIFNANVPVMYEYM